MRRIYWKNTQRRSKNKTQAQGPALEAIRAGLRCLNHILNHILNHHAMKEPGLMFFDTETTGLTTTGPLHRRDYLVQLGWVTTSPGGRVREKRSAIIKPDGWTIPTRAAKVHGITTEHATAHGIPLEAALAPFAEALEDCSVIIAHNMAFDFHVLEASFARAAMLNPLWYKERFCTMEAGTGFCNIWTEAAKYYGRPKWPTLEELHLQATGKPLKGAHNALIDVLATRRVFFSPKFRAYLASYRHELEPASIAMQILFDHITTTTP